MSESIFWVVCSRDQVIMTCYEVKANNMDCKYPRTMQASVLRHE